MNKPNRFPGRCHNCGNPVPAHAGHYVTGCEHTTRTRIRRPPFGAVWCRECFAKAAPTPDASAEDACCGSTAYEDACAAACGL